jgi:hypothetical protein
MVEQAKAQSQLTEKHFAVILAQQNSCALESSRVHKQTLNLQFLLAKKIIKP